MAIYLDTSALVKLAIEEPESQALRAYVARHPEQLSCALIRVELIRAVRRHDASAMPEARRVLERLTVIDLDGPILAQAALIEPTEVGSLDTIHVAAALTLGDQLEAIVTYDTQMADAARARGLPVAQPR